MLLLLFGHKKGTSNANASAIWFRGLREYVPSLNKRVKWHNQSDITLKMGNLEWVIEPINQRGYYPLA